MTDSIEKLKHGFKSVLNNVEAKSIEKKRKRTPAGVLFYACRRLLRREGFAPDKQDQARGGDCLGNKAEITGNERFLQFFSFVMASFSRTRVSRNDRRGLLRVAVSLQRGRGLPRTF